MKTCEHCGKSFEPKYASLKLCFDCFKKREIAFEEYDDLKAKVARLYRDLDRALATATERAKAARYDEVVAENWKLRQSLNQAATIPPEKLRLLVQLCHPDKHNGSQAANDLTAWLLALKRDRAA